MKKKVFIILFIILVLICVWGEVKEYKEKYKDEDDKNFETYNEDYNLYFYYNYFH